MRVPRRVPSITTLVSELDLERTAAVFQSFGKPTVGGKYLHWDDLRHRAPPHGLSVREWWLTLKLAREFGRKQLPFEDTNGRSFSYVLTDEALEMVHRIDGFATGLVEAPEAITNSATRDRYLVTSLMEEAIASSLLEGAATTRREAKALLRSGRRPRTPAERMVVNNYLTMQQITQDLALPLSVEMVKDLHRTVTEGTLENPDHAGRFQQPGEVRVDVGDPHDPDIVFHRPPPAEELDARIGGLTEWANAAGDQPFIHPVIRAIALHFYLAYVHPFADGNGRTARALFYRSLLRQGYWLAEFISISPLLQKSPTKYGRAFTHVETDDADFTYFLLHQLDVLSKAIDHLFVYLERKTAELRSVEHVLRRVPGLNHRQLALLSHAVRHPDAAYTFESHRASQRVTYQTARVDLLDLESREFLERHTVGRQFRFYPSERLVDLLGHDT
ncbi:MAG: Fic family protein [bacterium]|nr:Fic family protein [bacterium]MDE0289177.1 Fic family protein [bacterium]MDE0377218.1 Fic family protein [bacterium]